MFKARFVVGTALLSAALFLGATTTASAEPLPPGCTAADLAGAMSSAAAGTAVYLATHPDVNAFFTGLKGMPKDQMRERAREYLDANPHIRAEIQGARQPTADFHNRCG